VPLIFQKDKLEGNFRFTHAMVRKNAEPILLSQATQMELKVLERECLRVILFQKFIAFAETILRICQEFFVYSATVVVYAVVGITILNESKYREMEPAELAKFISNVLQTAHSSMFSSLSTS
jgi:ABC-type uncharacterized transport system fused permease/ATPase subunit